MALEWKLRKVMAERNIWTGAELSRLQTICTINKCINK